MTTTNTKNKIPFTTTAASSSVSRNDVGVQEGDMQWYNDLFNSDNEEDEDEGDNKNDNDNNEMTQPQNTQELDYTQPQDDIFSPDNNINMTTSRSNRKINTQLNLFDTNTTTSTSATSTSLLTTEVNNKNSSISHSHLSLSERLALADWSEDFQEKENSPNKRSESAMKKLNTSTSTNNKANTAAGGKKLISKTKNSTSHKKSKISINDDDEGDELFEKVSEIRKIQEKVSEMNKVSKINRMMQIDSDDEEK